MQPRNQPVRAWRVTMTPAPHESQVGAVAPHEALVQRDEAPATTAKPLLQLWQRGAR